MNAWIALLRQSADFYYQSTVETASGETRTVFPGAPSVTGVKCNVQSGRGRQEQTDQGLRRVATYDGFFLPGAVLVEGDRVLVDGTMYQATFVHRAVYPASQHHVKVTLEKVIGAT